MSNRPLSRVLILPLLASFALAACTPRSSANTTALVPTSTSAPAPTARPEATVAPVPTQAPKPAAGAGLTRDNAGKLVELYTRKEVIPRSLYTAGPDRVGLFSGGAFEAFDLKTLESLGDMQTGVNTTSERYWYALSADGRIGALMFPNGDVQIYDVNRGVKGARFKTSVPLPNEAADLALDREGREAVIVSRGEARRVDAKTGKVIGEKIALDESVGFVMFSRDAARLAVFRPEGRVEMIDTLTGKRAALADSIAGVETVSFNQDGRQFATATSSKLSVWDTSTGKTVWSLDGQDSASTVVFPPKGTTLGLYSGSDLSIIDYKSEKLVRTFKLSSGGVIRSALFSEDGAMLFAEGGGLLESFDVETGKLLASIRRFAATEVAYTQDGRLIAWSDQYSTGEVAALDGADGRTTASLMHTDPVRRAIVGRVGRFAASSTVNRGLAVWRLDDGKKMVDVPADAGVARGILCLDSGEKSLAYFENGQVYVREIETGARRKPFKPPYEDVIGLASCDNKAGLLAFHDAKNIDVMTLDGQSRTSIEMSAPVTEALRLSFNDEGSLLAAVLDGKLMVWQTTDGKVLREDKLDDDSALVVFGGSGDQLILSDRTSTALVNARTGKRVDLEVPGTHLVTLLFPPDSGVVVATARIIDENQPELSNGDPNFTSGEITVYDAQTGKAIRRVPLDAPINGASLSPDGSRLAIARMDGSVSVWGVK
jgi:WD40 repeat protein